MAQSAKTQVAQTVKVARPKTVAVGKKGKSGGKLTFDNIPEGIKLPAQIDICIDAYFALLSEGHEMISIADISEKADLIGLGYAQDGVQILAKYKLNIEGVNPWKHFQGCVRIGTFG